jgi:hypothetical protein
MTLANNDILDSKNDGLEDAFDRERGKPGHQCVDSINLPDDLNCERDKLNTADFSSSSMIRCIAAIQRLICYLIDEVSTACSGRKINIYVPLLMNYQQGRSHW